MKRPIMIMFDYANTLVDEKPYDVVNGMISVLEQTTTFKVPMEWNCNRCGMTWSASIDVRVNEDEECPYLPAKGHTR